MFSGKIVEELMQDFPALTRMRAAAPANNVFLALLEHLEIMPDTLERYFFWSPPQLAGGLLKQAFGATDLWCASYAAEFSLDGVW